MGMPFGVVIPPIVTGGSPYTVYIDPDDNIILLNMDDGTSETLPALNYDYSGSNSGGSSHSSTSTIPTSPHLPSSGSFSYYTTNSGSSGGSYSPIDAIIMGGDMDQDGIVDIVVNRNLNEMITVFKKVQGAWTMQDINTTMFDTTASSSFSSFYYPPPTVGIIDVELVDLDGDGVLDIVYQTPATFYYYGEVMNFTFSYFKGPDFTEQVTVDVPGTAYLTSERIEFLDIDGDGDIDCVPYMSDAGIQVFLSDGATKTGPAFSNFTYGNASNMYQSIRVGDWNGDSFKDIFAASSDNSGAGGMYGGISAYEWYMGGAGGALAGPYPANIIGGELPTGSSSGIYSFEPADIDGDGMFDLFAAVMGGEGFMAMGFLYGRGTDADNALMFEVQAYNSSTAYITPLGYYDVDGDGDLDVVGASITIEGGELSWGLSLGWGETGASGATATLGSMSLATADAIGAAVAAAVGAGVAAGVASGVASGVGSGVGSGTGSGGGGGGAAPDASSAASQSSATGTTATMMIGQVQFLALLGGVSAAGDSAFATFASNLGWINLWIPFDFAKGGQNTSSRRLSASPGWIDNDDVVNTFVGNTILVFGGLLVISLIQLIWGAYVGAKKIAKKRLDENSESKVVTTADFEEIQKNSDDPFLFFPSFQILFSMFCFQGQVQAACAVLRSGAGGVVFVAILTLIFFPVMLMVYLISLVRRNFLAPSAPLRYNATYDPSVPLYKRAFVGVTTAWGQGKSIMDWGANGEWEAAALDENHAEPLESRRLRLAYKPVFLDYTQFGCVIVIFDLCKMFYLGLCSGLATSPKASCILFLISCAVETVVVGVIRPLNNSAQNFQRWILCMFDFMQTLLLAISVFSTDTISSGKALDGVMYLSFIKLICVMVPLYIDTFIIMGGLAVSVIKDFCKKSWRYIKGERTVRQPKAPQPKFSFVVSLMCPVINEHAKVAKSALFSDLSSQAGKGSTISAIRLNVVRRMSGAQPVPGPQMSPMAPGQATATPSAAQPFFPVSASVNV